MCPKISVNYGIQLIYNHSTPKTGDQTININRDVPQGSLISPFLFNIYIDDLLRKIGRQIGDNNIFAFAYHLLFITCGRTETEKAVKMLENWCQRNGMEVNSSKNKVVVLCKKKGMKALNIHKIEDFDIVDTYVDPSLFHYFPNDTFPKRVHGLFPEGNSPTVGVKIVGTNVFYYIKKLIKNNGN